MVDSKKQAPAASQSTKDTSPRTVRRVLVVDDDIDNARALAVLVDTMGHEAQYAINGIVALHVAQRFMPDIVFLDLRLPDIHGAEMARQLRTNPELRHTRIIAVTASDRDEDKIRALAAGCDEFFLKPVMIEEYERLLGS